MIEKQLEKLKTHDLKYKESGIVLRCTGNYIPLQNRFGVIIELEDKTINQDEKEECIFKNYTTLSIGAISRDLEFVKKIRPEGHLTNSCNNVESSFETLIETFIQNNEEVFKKNKIRRLNTIGGITDTKEQEGSLFDLSEAPILSKNTREVVKRLKIDHQMLNELISNEGLTKELFVQIEEELAGYGINYYTFERPDGGIALYREPFNKYCELRAFGYGVEDE